MKKFMVMQKQHGYGCDYTIGCGMRFDVMEAESKEALIEEIIFPDGRDECSAVEGDSELKELLVVEMDSVESVDLSKFKELVDDIKEERYRREKDEEDRKEYERLQEKFGDKK